MTFHSQANSWKTTSGKGVSRLGAALLLVFEFVPSSARTHEVRPQVADLVVSDRTLTLEIEASIEPFLAGADLDGLTNTNASEVAVEIGRLRALPPDAVAVAFAEYWPRFRDQLRARSGGEAVAPELRDVLVGPIGDTELPRSSVLSIHGNLPPGGAPVEVGWAAELGALVLRQMEADPDPYTGYL